MTSTVQQLSALNACPGCGLLALDPGTPAPTDYRASAGCWERYGQLLSRSYSDPAYRVVHQVIVDAYTAQHASGTTRQEVQRVALCLMTLCLFTENDVDPTEGPALHKRMVAHPIDFTPLTPPPLGHLMTIADVLAAQNALEHRSLSLAWGQQIWNAWAPHHETVRSWNAQALA